MITVKDLLNSKGTDVWHVKPESTVYQALQLMAEKEIGAVLILEDGKIAGIFSERDYVRKLVKNKEFSDKSKVSDFMTKGVVTVRLTSDLFVCMVLMTNMHIRHLPVVEGEKLIGIITIGDVVNAIIHAQKQTIQDLEGYIIGEYGPKA